MPQRVFASLPIPDEAKLEADRRTAIAAFIAERSAEGGRQYRDEFQASVAAVSALFEATSDLLDLTTGDALVHDPRLMHVARYLASPPVSADDLDTLAEEKVGNRKSISPALARRAAAVIERVSSNCATCWMPRRRAR